MAANQNWPFIFTGVLGITIATLVSYALYLRNRHNHNLELIASSFPNVVNFSLNFIENGTLKFRTLFETTVEGLSRNPVLAQKLSDARDMCTEDSAFFKEPATKRSWFGRLLCVRRLRRKIWGPEIEWRKASEHLHMAILNELSSRYSQGHFGHGMIGLKMPSMAHSKHSQLDVVSENFCFGITCEQNKDVRAKKVRVMIASKEFLITQVRKDAPEPKLERPGHWVRWRTLLEMKQAMEDEERMRLQGLRHVPRVWEVTLSFMLPRLKINHELQQQKEGLCAQIEALSSLLRSSSDMLGGGTRYRGKQKPEFKRAASANSSLERPLDAIQPSLPRTSMLDEEEYEGGQPSLTGRSTSGPATPSRRKFCTEPGMTTSHEAEEEEEQATLGPLRLTIHEVTTCGETPLQETADATRGDQEDTVANSPSTHVVQDQQSPETPQGEQESQEHAASNAGCSAETCIIERAIDISEDREERADGSEEVNRSKVTPVAPAESSVLPETTEAAAVTAAAVTAAAVGAAGAAAATAACVEASVLPAEGKEAANGDAVTCQDAKETPLDLADQEEHPVPLPDSMSNESLS